MNRGDASSSLKLAILTPPKQVSGSTGLEEKTITTEGRKPLLDAFQLFGMS
jgi:hypothetical protein